MLLIMIFLYELKAVLIIFTTDAPLAKPIYYNLTSTG